MRFLLVLFFLISSPSNAQEFIVPDIEGNHGLFFDSRETVTFFSHFSKYSTGLHAKQDVGIEKIVVSEGNFKNPKNTKEFYENIYSFWSDKDKPPKQRGYEIVIDNKALLRHLKNLITLKKKFTFSIYQNAGGYWAGIETDLPPQQLSLQARYITSIPALIAKVNAEKLNVRAISNSKVVHVIDRGDWVPVFSVEGGWAHIGHNRKVYAKIFGSTV